MRRVLLSIAAAGALAACGATSTATTSSSGTTPGAGGGSSPTIKTGTTSLGTVLVDSSSGFTLYYFTPEQNSTIGACTGGCLTTWPPLTATGTPTAASGISGTLATVTLAGGTTEVTYNGWPLHRYAGDTAAGQTNGQGIAGKWFAATPSLTAQGGGASGGGSTPTSSATNNPY